MEDDLQKKWKTNQSTKINLIGCNTIVNSPSFIQCFHILGDALTEVVKEIHSGQLPSKSQRTSPSLANPHQQRHKIKEGCLSLIVTSES